MIPATLLIAAFLFLVACLFAWACVGAGREWAWLPWATSFLPLVAVAFAVAATVIDDLS